MITSIDGLGEEAQEGTADEGSNTVQQADSPDIISTYTANEEQPEVGPIHEEMMEACH